MRHLNFYYFNAKVDLNDAYIDVVGNLFLNETTINNPVSTKLGAMCVTGQL
jgi:hypothetical protein